MTKLEAVKRGDKVKWARMTHKRPLRVARLEFVTVSTWGELAPFAVTLMECGGVFPMGCFDPVDAAAMRSATPQAEDGRTPPELLAPDERTEILADAEALWGDLQRNDLGGFSGINRPFYILHEFKRIIERYGRRDVGLNWSNNELAALAPQVAAPADEDALRAKYDELIFAVGLKHPDETRHETALRYIQQAESNGSDEARLPVPQPGDA